MYTGLHVKYRLFLLDFNVILIFWADFRKIIKYNIFIKIHPVGAELFYADGRKSGRRDMTKLTVAFSQVCGKHLKINSLVN